MYLVYLLKEKSTNQVIYVGSTARPAARMKEHNSVIVGRRGSGQKLYEYIQEKNLTLYKDIEVVWVDCADTKEEMYELETMYYYKHEGTVKNDRPAENRCGANNPRRKAVRCLTDGKEFKCISDCLAYYKKGRTTLMRVLCGEREYTYVNGEKYRFEFIDKPCNDYRNEKAE